MKVKINTILKNLDGLDITVNDNSKVAIVDIKYVCINSLLNNYKD